MSAENMYGLEEAVQEVKNQDVYIEQEYSYSDTEIEIAILNMTEKTIIGEDTGNDYYLYDEEDLHMAAENLEFYIEDTSKNSMSVEDRMDGLIKIVHVDELLRTTIEICEDFLEEGFDPSEIKSYLHKRINNVVNFQSESSPYKEIDNHNDETRCHDDEEVK